MHWCSAWFNICFRLRYDHFDAALCGGVGHRARHGSILAVEVLGAPLQDHEAQSWDQSWGYPNSWTQTFKQKVFWTNARMLLAGSKFYKLVRRANRLIRRVVYVLLGQYLVNKWYIICWFCVGLRCEYLFKKDIHYAIEQPNSSLLWYYPPMEAWATSGMCCQRFWFLCQEMLRRHNCKAVSVPLGAYGAKSESLGWRIDSVMNALLWIWIHVWFQKP